MSTITTLPPDVQETREDDMTTTDPADTGNGNGNGKDTGKDTNPDETEKEMIRTGLAGEYLEQAWRRDR